MLTLKLNVGRLQEPIAKLAADYHSCDLLVYALETGPAGKGALAWFRCPSRDAANALVATLFNFTDGAVDEMRFQIMEASDAAAIQ